MKLATKLVAIVLLEMAVLLAIDGYLAVRRETRLYQADIRRDVHLVGNTLKHLIAETWQTEGQDRVLQLLDIVNREQNQLVIRWVWLDGAAESRYRPLAPAAAIASVAKGHELTVPVTDQEGQRYSCTYVPIALATPRSAAMELAEPFSQVDSFTSRIAARNLVLGLVLVLAGGASVISLGVVLVGRPLNQLSAKARQIGQGDLTPSLQPRGHDELAELARAMNDMCRRLGESQEQTRREQDRRVAAIEQLRQADRLRTVGLLAAEIAHELGTPLNTISIRSGMVADSHLSRDEITENAKIIKSQSQRMTAIIRQLLDNARPRPSSRARVDLRQVAGDTITLLAPLARKHNAEITLDQSESACAATVDVGQIEQVLTNLLVNALQAKPAGERRVEVDIRHKEVARPSVSEMIPSSQYIRIRVRDDGEGIAEVNLKNIFDPFFTTKAAGQGTGLGLSIAYGIVQEHGGWIDVTNRPKGGSCFAVYLPSAGNDECPSTDAKKNGNSE